MLSKYIIVKTGAILFNKLTTHSQVAATFSEVFSAGFCKIDFDKTGRHEIKCTGNSSSLKIGSIPSLDEFVIRDTLAVVSQIEYLGFDVEEMYKEYHKTHITADSIVAKIAQLPLCIMTGPVKHVQGDEKLCKQYLVEVYEQRHNTETMIPLFGEKLLKEIVTYVETNKLK